MICMAGRHVKLIGIMSAACWPVPEPASPSNLASRRFTSFPWDTSIQPQRGRPCAAEKGLGFRAAGPSTVCCKDERRVRRPFSVECSSARLPVSSLTPVLLTVLHRPLQKHQGTRIEGAQTTSSWFPKKTRGSAPGGPSRARPSLFAPSEAHLGKARPRPASRWCSPTP